MSFQTQCPHCGKVLKLKSEAAVGRKAPCPKCKTPFVVEPYEEPPADEWDDAGDEYGYDYSDDDYEDTVNEHEEVEPASSRSSRKSSSKGSKKKKKSADAPAWLAPAGIGLAVLLGLGLLGGGAAFLIFRSGEDASAGGSAITSQEPAAVADEADAETAQADSNIESSPPTPQQSVVDLAEPSTGFIPGGADAATQADIEALQKEKAGVLDTTNDIRNRIKSGTGSILDSVPGSR